MCGITGIWQKGGIDIHKFYESHLQIKHRGPDDEGFSFLNNSVINFAKGDDTISYFKELPHIHTISSDLIFGHRRLSILDLSEKGHQPMVYEQLSIVFNGEIFNYKEIRDELIVIGYDFTSNSDTEVVLKGFHCWGEEILNKMDGMWSIAIFNTKLNTLFLSRDNFGIKPLYYYTDHQNTFIFSSEIKFITHYLPELKKPNLKKVQLYLEHIKQDVDEETFFKGIYQLKPGFHITVNANFEISEKQYYCLRATHSKSDNSAIFPKLRELLNSSLKSRLLSDVKVGSLLSGGLDSNVIVSNLADQKIVNKENFEAFSAVYNDNNKIDEYQYVEATRKLYDLNVHYIKPEISHLSQTIDELLFHIEEPFRSLSVFAQIELYKKIRKESEVRVVMNGQGSDEIFGGYHHHLLFGLGEDFGSFKWSSFIRNYQFINFKMNFNHFKMLVKYCLSAIFKSNYFNHQLIKEISYSPLPEYLKYDDRTSMAYGIEARPPFLSKDLVDFALSIPLELKIKNGQGKFVLRSISRGIVADEILDRKDKMGFVTPQEVWMQTTMKDEVLQTLKGFDFVNAELAGQSFIDDLLERYQKNTIHWQKVWQYYIVAKWYKKWIA